MGNQASSQCTNLETLIDTNKNQFLEELSRDVGSNLFPIDNSMINSLKYSPNFIVFTKGIAQSQQTWNKLEFSISVISTAEVPIPLNHGIKITFHSLSFVIFQIDSISCYHLTFFLNKAKIFLSRLEFLNRMVLCATNCDLSLLQNYKAKGYKPSNDLPTFQHVDPFAEPAFQSESAYQSSSYFAYKKYKGQNCSSENDSQVTQPKKKISFINQGQTKSDSPPPQIMKKEELQTLTSSYSELPSENLKIKENNQNNKALSTSYYYYSYGYSEEEDAEGYQSPKVVYSRNGPLKETPLSNGQQIDDSAKKVVNLTIEEEEEEEEEMKQNSYYSSSSTVDVKVTKAPELKSPRRSINNKNNNRNKDKDQNQNQNQETEKRSKFDNSSPNSRCNSGLFDSTSTNMINLTTTESELNYPRRLNKSKRNHRGALNESDNYSEEESELEEIDDNEINDRQIKGTSQRKNLESDHLSSLFDFSMTDSHAITASESSPNAKNSVNNKKPKGIVNNRRNNNDICIDFTDESSVVNQSKIKNWTPRKDINEENQTHNNRENNKYNPTPIKKNEQSQQKNEKPLQKKHNSSITFQLPTQNNNNVDPTTNKKSFINLDQLSSGFESSTNSSDASYVSKTQRRNVKSKTENNSNDRNTKNNQKTSRVNKQNSNLGKLNSDFEVHESSSNLGASLLNFQHEFKSSSDKGSIKSVDRNSRKNINIKPSPIIGSPAKILVDFNPELDNISSSAAPSSSQDNILKANQIDSSKKNPVSSVFKDNRNKNQSINDVQDINSSSSSTNKSKNKKGSPNDTNNKDQLGQKSLKMLDMQLSSDFDLTSNASAGKHNGSILQFAHDFQSSSSVNSSQHLSSEKEKEMTKPKQKKEPNNSSKPQQKQPLSARRIKSNMENSVSSNNTEESPPDFQRTPIPSAKMAKETRQRPSNSQKSKKSNISNPKANTQKPIIKTEIPSSKKTTKPAANKTQVIPTNTKASSNSKGKTSNQLNQSKNKVINQRTNESKVKRERAKSENYYEYYSDYSGSYLDSKGSDNHDADENALLSFSSDSYEK